MTRDDSIQFWSQLIVGSDLKDVQRFMTCFALERERELRAEWIRQGTAILNEPEAVYPPHYASLEVPQ